jgi:hypothetical protein
MLYARLSLMLTVVGLLAGCGGGSGGRIEGKVLYNGAPLSGAKVVFEPKDKNLQSGYIATTNDKGEYVMVPVPGAAIKPGKYGVAVTKYVDKKGKEPDAEDIDQLIARGDARSVLPRNYADPVTSDLYADVKEGTTIVPPFELRGPKKK